MRRGRAGENRAGLCGHIRDGQQPWDLERGDDDSSVTKHQCATSSSSGITEAVEGLHEERSIHSVVAMILWLGVREY